MQFAFISIDVAWHIITATLFKGFEDAYFIGETLLFVCAAKIFVHVAIEINFDERADAVFKVSHGSFGLMGSGQERLACCSIWLVASW